MSNLAVIKKNLFGEKALNRMAVALGQSTDGVMQNPEVTKYASSVLAEIERSMSDSKKDLSQCAPNSIVQAMIDSAQIRLPIDGRQFAHLVKYGRNVTFQVGYRGYLGKLKEHYNDMTITVEPVYEGDDFDLRDDSGYQTYNHTKNDPFQDESKLKGMFCCLTWTENGNRNSKVTVLSSKEINKIKSSAKQTFIWDKWFIEKAKAATIKRACKIHFASLTAVQEVVNYDNEKNFDLDKTVDMGQDKPNVIDNLNKEIKGEEEDPADVIIDAEAEEVIIDDDVLPGDM